MTTSSMPQDGIHRIPERRCPSCGTRWTAMGAKDPADTAPPVPGMVVCCIQCAEPFIIGLGTLHTQNEQQRAEYVVVIVLHERVAGRAHRDAEDVERNEDGNGLFSLEFFE